MDRVALAECTSEELASALAQVNALENAVRSARLELIQVCDERKAWVEDGCPSLESWLGMRLGIAWRTAAEWVRVARALSELPAVSAAFSSGAISWDKVRALAMVARPETDAELAEVAPQIAVSQLERAARRARERSEEESAAAGPGRGIGFKEHRFLPLTRIGGWLPNDVAEVIRRSVEREADRVPVNPETGKFDPYAARRADGLY